MYQSDHGTDNGDMESKVMVRRQALDWAPTKPTLLETNAGEGHLYRAVWAESCGRHLGIDRRFSRPSGAIAGECWRGDNAQLLPRAMASGLWDIIDIDTYANPWPLLRKALREVSRPLVVVATDATDRAMRCNNSDFAFAVAGIGGGFAASIWRTGAPLFRWYDDVIRWALAWAQEGARVKAVEAKRVHAHPPSGPGGAGAAGFATTRYYVVRYAVA